MKPLVRPWHQRRRARLTGRRGRRIIRTRCYRTLVANVPQSGKPALYDSRGKRADEFFDMLRERQIGVAALQESGPAIAREARQRKGFRAIHATPNSREWNSWQATGIVFRNDWFHLVDRHQITVEGLHLPIVLLEDRKTKWRFVTISGHAPTKRVAGAFRTRARINSEVDAYVARLQGAPVFFGIDANSGGYYVEGLRRAHKNYVDHLLVSPHWGVTHRGTVRMPRVSDHAFVEARLHPHWVGTQLNRLPK